MPRQPKISVVIPVYNVEAYLPRCVDSILNQSYQNLEILLVDDGARDSSGQICDAYAQKDSRIQVIHKENGGLSSARNAGIEAAAGEYLSFVDSDDYLEADAYTRMMALMDQYGVTLVCAGRYDVDEATGEKTLGLCPAREECIDAQTLVGRIFLWDNCDSSACDKLYHRSLFETFRYPVGKVCEDLPVTYQVVFQAGKAAMCPVPVYNYCHRSTSISSASLSEKSFHYPQHMDVIYPYIRQHHPAIEKQARFLRVRSLYYPLVLLEQASREQQETFRREYRALRRELRRHFFFILTYPRFPRQERLTDILMSLNLYRLLRPLFHR